MAVVDPSDDVRQHVPLPRRGPVAAALATLRHIGGLGYLDLAGLLQRPGR
jgi:hypothetical protein